jgi:hypothetical protein
VEKGKSRELFLVRGKKSLLFDENVEMKGRGSLSPWIWFWSGSEF